MFKLYERITVTVKFLILETDSHITVMSVGWDV